MVSLPTTECCLLKGDCMNRYDAVLFDLDGTLVDSQPGIISCFQSVFAQYEITPTQEQLKRFLGPPLRQSFSQFLPHTEVEHAVQLYRDYYAKHGIANSKLYPDVPFLLQALKENGMIICLATSKEKEVARQVLTYFELIPWFDYIGGASADTSMDTKTLVIQDVLRQPCVQGKSVVMVGDRDNDLQAAQNCKIDVAGVLYGYGTTTELSAYHPQFLATDIPALIKWLSTSI